MEYLAVLGRQPEISLAELAALFGEVRQVAGNLAVFTAPGGKDVEIGRLGGTMKLAVKLAGAPLEYLRGLPEGKLTIGVSDYSPHAHMGTANREALKLKKILVRHGRSVRVVAGQGPVISTAAALHNGLSGKNSRKVELILSERGWYRVVGVQDIDAYARRDQARPARDAKVGMLPPKLAQILINLCGPQPAGVRILDPFCGTGVVLQEALLMGYRAYGTDLDPRMVEYSEKNLAWLRDNWKTASNLPDAEVAVGDARNFQWQKPVDAVACEGYLGRPMSAAPAEIKLKTEKQACGEIILGFLANLTKQITGGTPVVIAAPAWLRENHAYSRLEILDDIEKLGYNVDNKSREGLLYFREGQVVARDIIILRKQ